MNGSVALAVITATTLSLSGSVGATEIPSKKPESNEAAAPQASPAPPSAKAADTKRDAEALKWDQLDPEALKRAAKSAKPKSPFAKVPAER